MRNECKQRKQRALQVRVKGGKVRNPMLFTKSAQNVSKREGKKREHRMLFRHRLCKGTPVASAFLATTFAAHSGDGGAAVGPTQGSR